MKDPVPLEAARAILEREDARKTDEAFHASNRAAVEMMLHKRQELGQLEPVDVARITALRSLAVAVDYDITNAALWKQYREALTELTPSDDGPADPFEEFKRKAAEASSRAGVQGEVRDPQETGAP